jgi:hypothetical protein
MNKRECTNELDWQAFCYAAGELDSIEAERFELLLAEDQGARESLARAVELTQVVAAAETQSGDFVAPSAVVRSSWSSRLSWMAIGSMAAVLLAMLWSGVIGSTWRATERGFHSQSRLNLALAWYQTRTELAAVREAGLWSSHGAAEVEDAALDVMPMDDSLDEAPSWLTTAVLSMSHDSGCPEQPAEPSES